MIWFRSKSKNARLGCNISRFRAFFYAWNWSGVIDRNFKVRLGLRSLTS